MAATGPATRSSWGYDPYCTLQSNGSVANNQGGISWIYNCTTNFPIDSGPLIDSNGHVIVGLHNGSIVALDPDNGSVVWNSTVPGSIYESMTIASNGTIYVVSSVYDVEGNHGCLSALTSNGSLIWATNFNGSLSSPCIDSNGTVYVTNGYMPYLNGMFGEVCAVAHNGTVLWRVAQHDLVNIMPVLGRDGSIYVVFRNNSTSDAIIALDSSGSILWSSKPINGPALMEQSYSYSNSETVAVAPDGTIYIANLNNNLEAYNSNGTLKWYLSFAYQINRGMAIAPNGMIIVGGDGLNAINPDGSINWTYTQTMGLCNSPCVSSDGLILAYNSAFTFVDNQGITATAYVVALSMNGELVWKIGELWLSGSITIGANSTIYVRGENLSDHCIMAINSGVPAGVILTPKNDNGHLRLTWSAPYMSGGSAITEYRIYRAANQLSPNYTGTLNYSLIATVPGNVMQYIDEDYVQPDGNFPYAYYVVAVNSAGPGLPIGFEEFFSSGPISNNSTNLVNLGIFIILTVMIAAVVGFFTWRTVKRKQ